MRLNPSAPLLDYPRINSYSGGLDFLRGVLAIWVMITHLVIWSGLTGQQVSESVLVTMQLLGRFFQPIGETHPAVLGFIVLSGYCIHRNGARRGRFNVRSYATRRAFRIVPTYVLASIVGLVVFNYWAAINLQDIRTLTGTQQTTWQGVLIKLTGISAFIPKIHFQSFQGNAPLTTVMVEMWLYVFYAVAMQWLVRGGLGASLWKVLAGAWFLGLVMVSGEAKYYSWWNNGSLVGFLPYWWIGAAAVNHSANPRFLNNWKLFILIYAVFTSIMASGILHGTALFLMAEARKIVLAVLFAKLIASIDGIDMKWIKWGAKLGHSSYSIYAYHAPILALILLLALPWWMAPWVVLAVSLTVYVIFESPFTNFGKKLAMGIGKRN